MSLELIKERDSYNRRIKLCSSGALFVAGKFVFSKKVWGSNCVKCSTFSEFLELKFLFSEKQDSALGLWSILATDQLTRSLAKILKSFYLDHPIENKLFIRWYTGLAVTFLRIPEKFAHRKNVRDIFILKSKFLHKDKVILPIIEVVLLLN